MLTMVGDYHMGSGNDSLQFCAIRDIHDSESSHSFFSIIKQRVLLASKLSYRVIK